MTDAEKWADEQTPARNLELAYTRADILRAYTAGAEAQREKDAKERESPIVVVKIFPCYCHRCIEEGDIKDEMGMSYSASHFIVCGTCGNKRCPRASDHRLSCTDSNESGQPGSIYPKAIRTAKDGES